MACFKRIVKMLISNCFYLFSTSCGGLQYFFESTVVLSLQYFSTSGEVLGKLNCFFLTGWSSVPHFIGRADIFRSFLHLIR